MLDKLKENWHTIVDAFHHEPKVLLIAVIIMAVCVGSTMLTIKLANKYEFLQYPLAILVLILIANFYIDISIWIINQIK